MRLLLYSSLLVVPAKESFVYSYKCNSAMLITIVRRHCICVLSAVAMRECGTVVHI